MRVLRKVLKNGVEEPIAINRKFKFDSYADYLVYSNRDTYERRTLLNTSPFVEYCVGELGVSGYRSHGWEYFRYEYLIRTVFRDVVSVYIPSYIIPENLDSLCMLCNTIDNVNLVLRMLWHGEAVNSIDLSEITSDIPTFKARYVRAMLLYKNYITTIKAVLD